MVRASEEFPYFLPSYLPYVCPPHLTARGATWQVRGRWAALSAASHLRSRTSAGRHHPTSAADALQHAHAGVAFRQFGSGLGQHAPEIEAAISAIQRSGAVAGGQSRTVSSFFDEANESKHGGSFCKRQATVGRSSANRAAKAGGAKAGGAKAGGAKAGGANASGSPTRGSPSKCGRGRGGAPSANGDTNLRDEAAYNRSLGIELTELTAERAELLEELQQLPRKQAIMQSGNQAELLEELQQLPRKHHSSEHGRGKHVTAAKRGSGGRSLGHFFHERDLTGVLRTSTGEPSTSWAQAATARPTLVTARRAGGQRADRTKRAASFAPPESASFKSATASSSSFKSAISGAATEPSSFGAAHALRSREEVRDAIEARLAQVTRRLSSSPPLWPSLLLTSLGRLPSLPPLAVSPPYLPWPSPLLTSLAHPPVCSGNAAPPGGGDRRGDPGD